MSVSAQFHVHIDASSTSPEFENILTRTLGFSSTDFDDSIPETDSFQPVRHFTRKPTNGSEFRDTFDETVTAAELTGGLEGYIEGEFPVAPALPGPRAAPSVRQSQHLSI
jgi:hypothetical protein